MLRKLMFTVLAAACVSGCYRVVVNTGSAPAPQSIDRPWQLSLVYGLVPPAELATQAQCPQGVSSVMTERSFLNGLVGSLSFSLLTPLHAKVTCAAGPAPSGPVAGR